MTERILDVKEAAEFLKLSPDTLRWMRHVGTGPMSFKIGRKIAYRESDIQAYVDEQVRKEEQRLAAIKESRNVL